jgi:valyl-tRNA synthetase
MTQSNPPELPRAYEPKQVEQRIYQSWLDGGYFTPAVDPAKKPFVIIQPPPNVTGELHLGHAQRAAVEDALTRWHRMLGDSTLWLPGVDHAGIATQVVVERELAKEGLTRHDLGRERFLERVWEWVNTYRGRIGEQHRRLGVSSDPTRERFTLDPGPSKAVRHTFVNLFRKGLIYRGERITNWCPRCATALSDLEVVHQETQGNLYHIRYHLADGDGAVTVATTRPETLLGDTAVAVNPQDDRYRSLVGKEVLLPVLGRRIPVIADEAVEMDFGTGALKITPGHDPNDFDIGERHGLSVISVIDLDGAMTADAGPYQGMDRAQARTAIVEQLEREGLLEKVEPYQHSVGHCQRCDQVVEPLVTRQWFVRMQSLAQPALGLVRSGEIRIIPERFTRVYENWMENIRDWCISRQLWWGHRIPVWYCHACEALTVEYEDPTVCSSCGSRDIHQDPDVLDTWFSSGLWPHSTLGWPDKSEELDYFYPTSVMETAHDILFFWVARMIMMGLENTGKAPFHTVFLSGLIRDVEGVKMSKTRGNVVDPIEAIETYGADSLRFAVTVGGAPGNDTRLGPAKLEAARNFANKLWNASRFVLHSLQDSGSLAGWSQPVPRTLEDRWVLSRLNHLTARVTRSLEEYQLGEAEQAIYEFLWDEYCDWYIEVSKVRLREKEGPSPLPVLAHVLEKTLRLLHPFMPFITEELWQTLMRTLPRETDGPAAIIIAPYPVVDEALLDIEAEEQFGLIRDLVRTVRNTRSEFRIEPRRPLEVAIHAGDLRAMVESQAATIRALASADPLLIGDDVQADTNPGSLRAVIGSLVLSIPMAGLVDLDAERGRLQQELSDAEKNMSRLEGHLKDSQFRSRAPEEVIEREEERLRDSIQRRQKIQELLAQLQ